VRSLPDRELRPPTKERPKNGKDHHQRERHPDGVIQDPSGDEGFRHLKQDIAGDILVAASFQLVHTLIDHDLVDEPRLMIYPVVLGAGQRLFAETSHPKQLRLDARTVDDLAYLTYQPTPHGSPARHNTPSNSSKEA